MRVLVADKFEESGLAGLAAIGCEVLYEPKLEGESLGARLAQSRAEVLVVRSTKVSACRDRQCLRPRADREGGCRRQHDRPRGRLGPRRRGLELPRQERDRGRGARMGAPPRARPAPRRADGRPSQRGLEQDRIRQGEGPRGPDARRDRPRSDRPRGRDARAGLRDARRRLEPVARRRPGRAPRRGAGRLDPRARGGLGRRDGSLRPDEGDEGDPGREVLRGDEAGRVLREHEPGRGRGRRGASGRRSRSAGSGPASTSSRRSPPAAPAPSRTRS